MSEAALFKFNHWSVCIGLGLACGYLLALRRAKQAGLPDRETENAIIWALGFGFILSRVVEVLLYQPHLLKSEGWITLFKVTEGISSYGGFAGGVLGLAVYYGLKRKRWWAQADVLAEAFMVGWVFGRLGCTIAMDHPGPKTTFFLAREGRHNCGLYEFLFTLLVIVPANFLIHRRKAPTGAILAATCLLYGTGRFALDFLRATDVEHADPRYAGFTLAQVLSVGVFLFGAKLLMNLPVSRNAPGPLQSNG